MGSFTTDVIHPAPDRPPLNARTLDIYSAQEVYDFIVAHLRRQGRPAATGVRCVYFESANNLKCAAGALIPNTDYNSRIEGLPWREVVSRTKGFRGEHLNLITALQRVHDDKYAPTNWEEGFQRTAREFGLQYTPRVSEVQHG